MILIQNTKQSENFSLSKIPQAVYSCPAFAKSKASRRKLNQSKANSNTPQACFFVCSTLTPKENNQLNFELVEFLSMVVRGRQGESLDRLPLMAEFLHSHALPPSRRKQRGNALNQQSKDTAMIFKFQSFTGEKRPNSTACTEKNNRLPNVSEIVYSDCTTKTTSAIRKRYLCGIFLSQIPFKNGYGVFPHAYSQAEFAVRAIRRNKADSIRTNKASCLVAIVESLSHLYKVGISLLLKPLGLLAMLFKFITLGEKRPNSTAGTEKNNRLPNVSEIVYSDCTTTIEGNRYPYSSGLFLSSFYQFTSVMPQMGVIRLSEFVKWSIWGNKAFSRTNNPSRSIAVVETISHPITVRNPLLTKTIEEIAMLFKFITLGEKRPTITVHARTEQEARQKAKFSSSTVCVARYSDTFHTGETAHHSTTATANPNGLTNKGAMYA